MELFKPYSKETGNSFCLIKLLFLKARCVRDVNVSLEAYLEGQGWQTTLFTICWFYPGGWDIFEKERTSEKDALKERFEVPLYTFYWDFMKICCKACVVFSYFLVIKGILKTWFSFILWLLNFSLPNYGWNCRERYTLRLLSKCLVRTTILPIGGNVSPTLWFPLRSP